MSDIPIYDLEHGRIYKLRSRNLVVGVWDEKAQGFIGLREKFGSRYLFTELHWDAHEFYGTAVALEALYLLPVYVAVAEGWLNDAPHKPNWEENLPLFRILDDLDRRFRNA